jgi:hypothetical protein
MLVQAENKIKETEKMKADSHHIFKTNKGSASSKRVYLAGSNANEEPDYSGNPRNRIPSSARGRHG